jgi:glutathione peroxidase
MAPFRRNRSTGAGRSGPCEVRAQPSEVNGPDADPLYQWLRAQAPGDFGPQYGGFYEAISRIRPEAEGTDEVKWNFTKFLIGRDGKVIKRYEPVVLPADIKADLENYL